MVFMARFENVATIEPDTEARAEQSVFDVVRRQRVAGEEAMDVAAADEGGNMFDTAGVNDRGAADKEGLPAFLLRANQLRRHLPDRDALGLLGRYRAVHELEALGLHLAPFRQNTHAGVADNILLANLHVSHRLAFGGTCRRINEHAAIHLLVLDFDPAAADPHFSSLIGCAVKSLWEGTGYVGCH